MPKSTPPLEKYVIILVTLLYEVNNTSSIIFLNKYLFRWHMRSTSSKMHLPTLFAGYGPTQDRPRRSEIWVHGAVILMHEIYAFVKCTWCRKRREEKECICHLHILIEILLNYVYIWLETSGAMWSTLSRGVSSMPPPAPVQNNLHVWLNFECSHFSWRNQWHRHGSKLAEKRWLWIMNSLHDHLSQLSCRQVSCKNMAWNCMVYEEKTTVTVHTYLSEWVTNIHALQSTRSFKQRRAACE